MFRVFQNTMTSSSHPKLTHPLTFYICRTLNINKSNFDLNTNRTNNFIIHSSRQILVFFWGKEKFCNKFSILCKWFGRLIYVLFVFYVRLDIRKGSCCFPVTGCKSWSNEKSTMLFRCVE